MNTKQKTSCIEIYEDTVKIQRTYYSQKQAKVFTRADFPGLRNLNLFKELIIRLKIPDPVEHDITQLPQNFYEKGLIAILNIVTDGGYSIYEIIDNGIEFSLDFSCKRKDIRMFKQSHDYEI